MPFPGARQNGLPLPVPAVENQDAFPCPEAQYADQVIDLSLLQRHVCPPMERSLDVNAGGPEIAGGHETKARGPL